MKTILQLKIGQSLSMTPQLQQAIRLLQLSSVELQTKVQEILESNMMLEVDDGASPTEESSTSKREETIPAEDVVESTDQKTEMNQDSLPDELEVDSGWEDIFDSPGSYTKTGLETSRDDFETQENDDRSLHQHLLWQLNLTPTSDTDKVIAMAIIDCLDDDGYLAVSVEDILATIDENDLEEIEVGTEEVEAVLHMVQSMEPAGVASRDVKECLSLQLNQCDPETEYLTKAKELVNNELDLLAEHNYKRLMRKLKLDEPTLGGVVNLIQSMNPRPGNTLSEAKIEYVTPDVYVKKEKGVWKIELNTDAIPSLKINSAYANMIRRADNSNDNNSLKSHLQEARWFIKSLRSRSETLLRVTSCIVEKQRGFLEHGEEAMRPLILSDIGELLDMHESTISRVTTRKYMHTPRGIFELKYFFSSHVGTRHGGTCSSTAIRALIKKLIHAETPNKPLSDSKIAAILKEKEINIARRTVAKYREAMSIPPSNERKRLA